MVENKISAEIDEVTLNKILDNLDEATNLIPMLTSLSVKQRIENCKMGEGSVVFVKGSHQQAVDDDNLRPPYVDLAEMKKDINYDAALNQIEIKITKLAERVSDTRIVVGSEAMNAALAIYNYIKMCVKQNIPGAKSAYDQLKTRFMYKKHDDIATPPLQV
jgi:hypothetical protein